MKSTSGCTISQYCANRLSPSLTLPKAIIGISETVERRKVDSYFFAPVCHILTRLVASEHRSVVAYAARTLNNLVLDDALRPQAARAGTASVLATALERHRGNMACLKAVLG